MVALVGFATRKPLVTVACPDLERPSRHPWLEVTANIELTLAAHTSDGLVLISVLRFDSYLDILVSDSTPTKTRVEELPHSLWTSINGDDSLILSPTQQVRVGHVFFGTYQNLSNKHNVLP